MRYADRAALVDVSVAGNLRGGTLVPQNEMEMTLPTIRRAFLALVLALAAGSAALAGSGLAVSPHADASGTPAAHDHLLAAYRYPLFLLRMTPAPAALGAGPHWSLDLPADAAAAALVFATLAAIVPLLCRPTRRIVAVFAFPALRPSIWRVLLILAPPRAPALRSA